MTLESDNSVYYLINNWLWKKNLNIAFQITMTQNT